MHRPKYAEYTLPKKNYWFWQLYSLAKTLPGLALIIIIFDLIYINKKYFLI